MKYLTKLKSLVLGNNQMTGEVPGGLRALTQLVSVSLHNNCFTGGMLFD